MKKIISFEKQITFPSMIGEITTLDLEHNLQFIDKSNIEGEFLLTGKYKLTEASRLEEEFSYKLPVEIILTEKLDLNTIKIDIEDFEYEIENEDTMNCKIKLKIEGVEEIEIFEDNQVEEMRNITEIKEPKKDDMETRECDSEPKEKEIPKKQIIEEKEEIIEVEQEENKITSVFNNLSESEETYSTYSVYILRQEETLNTIIEKYKTTKEELEKYNDLTNITIGSKIIVPSTNE